MTVASQALKGQSFELNGDKIFGIKSILKLVSIGDSANILYQVATHDNVEPYQRRHRLCKTVVVLPIKWRLSLYELVNASSGIQWRQHGVFVENYIVIGLQDYRRSVCPVLYGTDRRRIDLIAS